MAPQRWPLVMSFLDGQRENFRDLGNLQDQLKASVNWYLEQFPALTTDRKLEMENISGISAATVFICLDLKILSTQDGSQTLEALCAQDHGPLWNQVDQVIDSHLSNFASYIKAYLRWVFVKKDEQIWDVGSRPPVGRYSPGAQRRMGRGNTEMRSGSGPQRRSGPGTGGPRPSGNSRRNERDRGPDKSSGDRGPRRSQGPSRGQGGPQNHAEQERQALDAVHLAINKLKGEQALNEVKLDPSNSFFRRLQHKKAVAEGFFSYSTGEGAQRAVVVTREKPEQEEG